MTGQMGIRPSLTSAVQGSRRSFAAVLGSQSVSDPNPRKMNTLGLPWAMSGPLRRAFLDPTYELALIDGGLRERPGLQPHGRHRA